MFIGTVKEIKAGENRVGLTPSGVSALVKSGHTVLIEDGAGKNSGLKDEEYVKEGAKIVQTAKEVFLKSDMIVKVKELQSSEYELLSSEQILFTFLHLAAEKKLAEALLERGVTAIAYETIELEDGSLPLLAPMSAIAGRMAIQIGAHYLERTHGGLGKLLGGVPGVLPARVTILGGGVVGINATKMAFGLGAQVTVIEQNLARLNYIDDIFSGRVFTLTPTPYQIEKAVTESDLLIGAVAITGAATPKLVSREMVKQMKPGTVIIDVSVDQGGCVETARPTSLLDPIYLEEYVIHYCVPNMPGAVPHTSTVALTNATLPYVLKLTNYGLTDALRSDSALTKGVNTHNGKLTNLQVAEALGMIYQSLEL
ncbi:TPA: alanine dehydrogenase [Candidatus Poribacteria bacterium]|nr:alanine dehydrogenase [Candidatus Poribacteria bacterium]